MTASLSPSPRPHERINESLRLGGLVRRMRSKMRASSNGAACGVAAGTVTVEQTPAIDTNSSGKTGTKAGSPRRRLPNGYWTDERIAQQLSAFLGKRADWPTIQEFKEAGHDALYYAIARGHGAKAWARLFGVTPPHKGHAQRWTDERIEAELRDFIGDGAKFPSRSEFFEAGRGDLYHAARLHGGLPAWTQRCQVEPAQRRRKRRWTDARIEEELRTFLADRATWPSIAEFEAAEQEALLSATRRHGGVRAWAERCGVTPPSHNTHHSWTEERIEADIRSFLGSRTDWPTLDEFQRAGQRALYCTMSRNGGVKYWRQLCGFVARQETGSRWQQRITGTDTLDA